MKFVHSHTTEVVFPVNWPRHLAGDSGSDWFEGRRDASDVLLAGYPLRLLGYSDVAVNRDWRFFLCCFAIAWHFMSGYESTGVVSFELAIALEKSSNFIAHAFGPMFSVAALEECSIFGE